MTGLLLSLALLGQVQVEVQPETVVVVRRPQMTYTCTTTVTVPGRVVVVPAPKVVVTTKSYTIESPTVYKEVGPPILLKRGLFGRYSIVK